MTEDFCTADKALRNLALPSLSSSPNTSLLTLYHANLLEISEYAVLVYTLAYAVSTTWNVVPWPTTSFSRLGSKKDLFWETIPLT